MEAKRDAAVDLNSQAIFEYLNTSLGGRKSPQNQQLTKSIHAAPNGYQTEETGDRGMRNKPSLGMPWATIKLT